MKPQTNHCAVSFRKPSVIKGVFIFCAVICTSQSAFAEDSCTSAKNLSKALKGFYKADPSLKNIVDPTFNLSISAAEGLPQVTGLLYRDETQQHRFVVDEDEAVLGLKEAVDMMSSKGELCTMVDGEIVQKLEKSLTSATVSMTFPYLNTSGSLSMSEVVEGAKDASKVMKSLAPTGLGFVVPKLKSLVVSPPDEASGGITDGASDGIEGQAAALPTLSLLKNGEAVQAPQGISFAGSQYYHLSDLKKTKADTVIISGAHKLYASFGFKDKDIETSEKERLETLANPDLNSDTSSDK